MLYIVKSPGSAFFAPLAEWTGVQLDEEGVILPP